MANKIKDSFIFGGLLAVFVSILGFLGAFLGFLLTGNPFFLSAAIVAIQAIFFSVIGALVVGSVLTGFRGV